MKRVYQKITGINLFAFVHFVIYVIIGVLLATTFNFTAWNYISKLIQYYCVVVLGGIVFYKIINRHVKVTLLSACFLIAGVLNFVFTQHIFILVFSFLMIDLANIDFRKIVKSYLTILTIVFVLIVILALIGVLENTISYRYENGIIESKRYSFGFQAVTLPLSILFFLTIGFLYVYRKKLPYSFIVVDFFATVLLYKYTGTRTGFILNIFVLFVAILIKHIKFDMLYNFFNRKIIRKLVIVSPFLITIIMLLLCVRYDNSNPVFFKLNDALTGRLALTHDLLRRYNLNLFGSVIIKSVNGNYVGCDICFVFYMIEYGVFSAILVFILQSKTLKYAYNQKDGLMLFILILILINGIVEPYLIDFKYHLFSMVIMNSYLANNKTVRKKVCVNAKCNNSCCNI